MKGKETTLATSSVKNTGYWILVDELVQSLLEDEFDTYYLFSAYYPKVISAAIKRLGDIVEMQGKLAKSAAEALFRISKHPIIQDRYRNQARTTVQQKYFMR